MKRRIYICSTLLVISLTFTGCANENSSTDKPTTAPSSASDWLSGQSEKIDAAPIEILSLGDYEVQDILNEYSNLSTSKNLYVNVPQKAPVLDYSTRITVKQDCNKYRKEFEEMFGYLFPNHTLDENYLFYIGGSSKLEYDDDGNVAQNFNKVKECYDKIVSGEEGDVHFLYDESWYRDMNEWKSPVCLELGGVIGYGYAVINKGKAVHLGGKVSNFGGEIQASETYPCLESYDPAEYLERVGTYAPDSTESFRLLDKDVPINEAVAFCEAYINGLPYPKDANLDTCVVEVDVYKVNEDTYGYYFLTTKRYDGLTFDYMRSGTSHSAFGNYSFSMGYAFMLESNDIDNIYGYYRLQQMESASAYKEIVSFESAVKTMSEKLTNEVAFEVQKAEFLYCAEDVVTSEGYIDIDGGYPQTITPAWKFTLYNPNDDLSYVCYVDAKDGDNFRYYTTPSDLRLTQ